MSTPPLNPSEILASVADQMLEGVQIIGRDWRYLYANDTLVRQGKIPRDKLMGRTMMECYPGFENTAVYAQLRRCMGERVHVSYLSDFTFPDGSRGTFQLSIHPVEQGIMILSNDVTAQDRVLMESIGDGVFAVDKDAKVTLWNKASEHITGWKSDEAIGQPLRNIVQFLRNDDRTENMSFIDETLRTGIGRNMENDTVVITKDGRAVPVGDSAAPIRDPATGEVTGVIVVFRDMTDEYKIKSQERELIKMKNDFLFKTIHDLRTPVNIVGLLTHELTASDSPIKDHPQSVKMASRIEELNERMNRLIEDLFKIVKSEGDGFALEIAPVPLAECLRAMLDEASPLLAAHRITATAEIPPTSQHVLGDVGAMREIFTNLIDNAVKYSPEGSMLHLTHAMSDGFVTVTVRDEGVGIKPETVAKLFQPFYRGDARRDIPGTGLGLYIVKSLTEKMGGKVALASEPGKGTAVSISLPKCP